MKSSNCINLSGPCFQNIKHLILVRSFIHAMIGWKMWFSRSISLTKICILLTLLISTLKIWTHCNVFLYYILSFVVPFSWSSTIDISWSIESWLVSLSCIIIIYALNVEIGLNIKWFLLGFLTIAMNCILGHL